MGGNALNAISSVCLQTSYPSVCSAPHSVATSFKTLVAIVVECEGFSFDKAGPFKAYLADPSAFVSARTAAVRKTQRRLKNQKRRRRRRRLTWVAAWICLAVMVAATTIE